MRSRDLSPLELEIVMHIANGRSLGEIAVAVDRSRSYVAKQADRARRKTHAKTLPQLVSIVIASGLLDWDEHHRVLNGHDDEPASGDTSDTSVGSA